MKIVKEKILNISTNIFENYDEKCQEGGNDSHIYSMIRNISVKEFISYMNHDKLFTFKLNYTINF